MRRFWIGIGLLVGIVIAGLWTTQAMGRIHTSISEDLMASARAAQSEQWEQADALAADAYEHWHDSWHFSAALADHTVLDEIDGLFAQSEVYRQSRSTADYAATCARLSQHIDALQEGHKLSWWNLL